MLLAVQPLVRRFVVRGGAGFLVQDKRVRRHPGDGPFEKTKENQEMLQVAFPPTFEIAVYLQPPFNGRADTTCSWGVVSSHQGDIRQCPAKSVPIRPPERMLGANATLAKNSTNPTISTLPLNRM